MQVQQVVYVLECEMTAMDLSQCGRGVSLSHTHTHAGALSST